MEGGKTGRQAVRGGVVGEGGADKKRFVCLLFAYRHFFVCYLLIDFFPPFLVLGENGIFRFRLYFGLFSFFMLSCFL